MRSNLRQYAAMMRMKQYMLKQTVIPGTVTNLPVERKSTLMSVLLPTCDLCGYDLTSYSPHAYGHTINHG